MTTMLQRLGDFFEDTLVPDGIKNVSRENGVYAQRVRTLIRGVLHSKQVRPILNQTEFKPTDLNRMAALINQHIDIKTTLNIRLRAWRGNVFEELHKQGTRVYWSLCKKTAQLLNESKSMTAMVELTEKDIHNLRILRINRTTPLRVAVAERFINIKTPLVGKIVATIREHHKDKNRTLISRIEMVIDEFLAHMTQKILVLAKAYFSEVRTYHADQFAHMKIYVGS